MSDAPEVRLAARIVEKYKLTPPIDVAALIEKHATLIYEPIPIDGVDGVCINLKVPGKRPTVIINSSILKPRRRFTEAHELGHVLIPWHTGSIVDEVGRQSNANLGTYWQIESEADRFAAELLMPRVWIEQLLASEKDLSICHKTVMKTCEVSVIAAAIKLVAALPANIVYAVERAGIVEYTGRTQGTLASAPYYHKSIPSEAYSYADAYYKIQHDGLVLHWWVLPSDVVLLSDDQRSWREVLDGIVDDIGLEESNKSAFKSSVNAVLAAANGRVRSQGNHTAEAVCAAGIQRFHDRSEYKLFAEHPDFKTYVLKRAIELTQK